MSKDFVTDPADIQKLAHAIMTADTAGSNARSTYLRSLVAVVQQTLGGRPVLRVTGRPKRPEIDAAVTAFEEANTLFYTAVLEAVPKEATPEERQSRTSFARSSCEAGRLTPERGSFFLPPSIDTFDSGSVSSAFLHKGELLWVMRFLDSSAPYVRWRGVWSYCSMPTG